MRPRRSASSTAFLHDQDPERSSHTEQSSPARKRLTTLAAWRERSPRQANCQTFPGRMKLTGGSECEIMTLRKLRVRSDARWRGGCLKCHSDVHGLVRASLVQRLGLSSSQPRVGADFGRDSGVESWAVRGYPASVIVSGRTEACDECGALPLVPDRMTSKRYTSDCTGSRVMARPSFE